MAKYIIQGETLKAIADEVRDLVDITDEINPNEMIANMEQANADVAAQTEIIEQIRTALDGKAGSNAAEIGALIDQSGVLDSTEGTIEEKVEQLIDKAGIEKFVYELSGTWTSQFSQMFFKNSTKVLKLNFENATTCRSFFAACLVDKIDYYINCGKAQDINRMFQSCTNLKFLYGLDMSSALNCQLIFDGCKVLETIQESLNFSKITSNVNCFRETISLVNVRFVPESIKISITIPSPVLSAESIQSIIDGLATVETAQTLTLNANLKILQSQVDAANAKGWTVAGGTVVSEEEYYG